MKISLLTGANDPSYALPLLAALISKGVHVDFIGNDEMESAEAVKNENVTFLNFRGDQNPNATVQKKIVRILKYYIKLIRYAAFTDSKVFHILWLDKFVYFDRTILNTYYKILGKDLVFTAHNINAGDRDGYDNVFNRLSLKFMYRVMDHIFVHTERMKKQLNEEYGISQSNITVIPFGINNYVPSTRISSVEARGKLCLEREATTILFFGNIAPYKGLDQLILAFNKIVDMTRKTRLIIAGQINKGSEQYWNRVQLMIGGQGVDACIVKNIDFIPDEEVEIYFKAADVVVLPYRSISQTGVLFLAYNFGLPAIVTDVGSLREDVIEGETGFICNPDDPDDLADKINLYFKSDLFRNLERNREKIKEWAKNKHSWEIVAEKTYKVYEACHGIRRSEEVGVI